MIGNLIRKAFSKTKPGWNRRLVLIVFLPIITPMHLWHGLMFSVRNLSNDIRRAWRYVS